MFKELEKVSDDAAFDGRPVVVYTINEPSFVTELLKKVESSGSAFIIINLAPSDRGVSLATLEENLLTHLSSTMYTGEEDPVVVVNVIAKDDGQVFRVNGSYKMRETTEWS